jgi:hypothetical protein
LLSLAACILWGLYSTVLASGYEESEDSARSLLPVRIATVAISAQKLQLQQLLLEASSAAAIDQGFVAFDVGHVAKLNSGLS